MMPTIDVPRKTLDEIKKYIKNNMHVQGVINEVDAFRCSFCHKATSTKKYMTTAARHESDCLGMEMVNRLWGGW